MRRFHAVLDAQPALAASSDARRAKKKMKRSAKNYARAHKEMQCDLDALCVSTIASLRACSLPPRAAALTILRVLVRTSLSLLSD